MVFLVDFKDLKKIVHGKKERVIQSTKLLIVALWNNEMAIPVIEKMK